MDIIKYNSMMQEHRKALKSGRGSTEAWQGWFVWQKSSSYGDVIKSWGHGPSGLPGSYVYVCMIDSTYSSNWHEIYDFPILCTSKATVENSLAAKQL